MSQKQQLGQYFTKHYAYILQGMVIPSYITNIIEPFAGEKDLLHFISNETKYHIVCYDIHPYSNDIIKRNTLLNPPDYTDFFILTNPPFLARNKSIDKTIFELYGYNDLYKCFIYTMTQTPPQGGIIIVPLNFWCSIRLSDVQLRKIFLQTFTIKRVNVFEEDVFDDTTYAVCAIQFERNLHYSISKSVDILFLFYPSTQSSIFTLNEDSQWLVGGEIYNLPLHPNIHIERLTKTLCLSDPFICHFKLFAIDNNKEKQIRLEWSKELFIDNTLKHSERTFASFRIEPLLSEKHQQILIQQFNDLLKHHRQKYHSMFLSTYRESKTMTRKRITFQLVYRILHFLIKHLCT